MGERSETITVHLLGEPLRLRGASPEDVHTLARYVDEKLTRIREHNEALPLRSLLLLTSLNIAEDLFRERKEHEKLLTDLEDRTRRLRASLEEQLEIPGTGRERSPGAPTRGT